MPTSSTQLLSRTIYDIDGTTTVWNFSFSGGYIDPSHVKAYTELPNGLRTPIIVTPEMLIGEFQLQVTPALPPSAGLLVIYRDTPKDFPLVDFVEGPLSEVALDTNARQAVFIAAEAQDEFASTNYQIAVDAASAAVASANQANIDAGTAASAASAAGSSALLAAGAATAAGNASAAASTSASLAATYVGSLGATSGAANVGADDAASGSLFTTMQGFVDRVRSSVGAALVGFVQDGVGAVFRTLQDKAREVVSVTDFGAVGDGVTDDTAAFNAALTIGTSTNVIFVPPGKTYRITSTLNIVGNKTLTGPDSGSQNFQAAYILHDPASTGPLFNVTSTSNGVCIKNLTVTGGNGSFCISSSNAYVRYELIKMQFYNGSGIQLLSTGVGSSSSKLVNCEWIGPNSPTAYTGFEIDVNGGDVHLMGCTAIYGAIGVNIKQGETVFLDGCSVNKQTRNPNTATGASSSASQFDTVGVKLSGSGYKKAISIKNSYIEACDNGVYVEACESLSIEDNLFYDSGVSGVSGAWTAYGNSSIYLKDANVKNVTIKNNHITALSNGDMANVFYALQINSASNTTLVNNYIRTTGNYNSQLSLGARCFSLANTFSQSGSQPQPNLDTSNFLVSLNPRLPAWVNFTYQNSWANGGNAAYNKDNSNFVEFRGYVTSGTVGQVMATLPLGFRPEAQSSFAVPSNGALGIVTVFTNGNVQITAGNNAFVYLNGVRFEAA